MSIWISKGKTKTSISVPLELIVLLAGISAVLLNLRYSDNAQLLALDSAIAISLGFGLFLSAKISQFVNGKRLSWGSATMKPIFKWFYWSGYGLIVIGSITTGIFITIAGAM